MSFERKHALVHEEMAREESIKAHLRGHSALAEAEASRNRMIGKYNGLYAKVTRVAHGLVEAADEKRWDMVRELAEELQEMRAGKARIEE